MKYLHDSNSHDYDEFEEQRRTDRFVAVLAAAVLSMLAGAAGTLIYALAIRMGWAK